ncbi:paladin-like isoform X2 [Hypanus sabinus]|uniref:paladin-like isoform X2 n=1 Tax=Hypanus sabinus TaxID=79690 RepID=UPI0028C42CD6|nr:paladin-like isoform X2 [Hypanus sabinus]
MGVYCANSGPCAWITIFRRWCSELFSRSVRTCHTNSSPFFRNYNDHFRPPSWWIMGTTASAAQHTVSTGQCSDNGQSNGTPDSRRSISVNSFQTFGIHNKAKSIITNKVAPVLITYNCKEEFQIHDDLFKANFAVGRISDDLPEHHLVQVRYWRATEALLLGWHGSSKKIYYQSIYMPTYTTLRFILLWAFTGKYFMVCDIYNKIDVLNTMGSHGVPNFRQAKGSYPVFGMGQPSLNGFKKVLQIFQQEGYEDILYFCVREEPVVFLRVENDFIPYTPRRKENLHENLHNLGRNVKVEQLELSIRKELYSFAQLNENISYVYNDIEHFKDEPQAISICCEEDIHVTEEVYKRPFFTKSSCRYHRLPLSMDGLQLQAQIDTFINSLRETPSLLLLQESKRPPPALVFSCQIGVGRTNLAMILGVLVLYHRKGLSEHLGADQNPSIKKREQLQVIQSFAKAMPKGQQIVDEVDAAIALCSEMHDIKEAIYECKQKLEAIGETCQAQGNSTKEYFLQRVLQSTECYFYLVAFNYYLHEQYPLAFSLNFSKWMCSHPWMFRILAGMDVSELTAPCDLITKGIRLLVTDEVPDVLSTMKEMKVANFRRVPKMPIYGMAQPSLEACGTVLTYLTEGKRSYTNILWVTLREEVVLEGNSQMYTLREPAALEQPIRVPMESPEQLEKLESNLKNEILTSQKLLEVRLGEEKQMKLFKSCFTMQEIFNQLKGSHQGLLYRRIPILDCGAPRETDFDKLMEAIKMVLTEDSCSAVVFNCHNGKGRTTTAMVISVLIFWHLKGIPENSEDELVSVPDAKYTKGEFEVVMEIVRLLPEGHKMKREVDLALDAVSETMTPMHYHLREIIICTYRQIKTAKSEKEIQLLQLRSLQYLERYIYLILFNTYLHLEKKNTWQRPFSTWMNEVAAKAGVYEILNRLGFLEFEEPENTPLSQLCYRWLQQNTNILPFRGEFI